MPLFTVYDDSAELENQLQKLLDWKISVEQA
jgi:hypothetical protein